MGKTSSDNGATVGIDLRNDGRGYFAFSGGRTLDLNRLSSDGSILEFRKDGTTVGTIYNGGSNLGVNSQGGLLLVDDIITPTSGADNTKDLGRSSARWKDLYLGGTIIFGDSHKLQNDAFDNLQILSSSGEGMKLTTQSASDIVFETNNNERMRINDTGNVLISTTSSNPSNDDVTGTGIASNGRLGVSHDGSHALDVNRKSDDGNVVIIRQAGNVEGSISVSGTTTSFNGFTGTHWSRLSDNSKPTILKGTILESLDEMMDWYQVQFDITETDDEGNETTTTQKQSYALGDGESVGDVITYTYEGTDYQATILKEGDVKHTKSKVSDTVDAKNVYGVFMDWDNDDDTVNDMYVAQTGTFVVRMNSAETVSKGDLIQSNGDGTGKVQADDIIRASTVAKVLSTTKIETYEDGSYIVPCSLHC